MEILNECLICSKRVETNPNKCTLENNVTIYFVVRKLLEISDVTCAQLLKNFGNPITWFTCCLECSIVIIEAENIFKNIVKLESKFKTLKDSLEGNILDSTYANPCTIGAKTIASSKLSSFLTIRDETVQRMQRAYESAGCLKSSEDIKIEIEEEYSYSINPDGIDYENGSPSPPTIFKFDEPVTNRERRRSGRLKSRRSVSDIEISSNHSKCLSEEDGEQTYNLENGEETKQDYIRKYDVETKDEDKSLSREFECSCCSKIFTTKFVLERHLYTVHGKGRFKAHYYKNKSRIKTTPFVTRRGTIPCTYCDKLFCTVSSRNVHQKTKHGMSLAVEDRKLQDSIKIENEDEHDDIIITEINKEDLTQLNGKICSVPNVSKNKKIIGIKSSHPEVAIFNSTRYVSISDDRDDVEEGTLDTDANSMEECDIEQTERENAGLVEDEGQPKKSNVFKCSCCNKECTTKFILERHLYTVHGKGEQKTDLQEFQCNVCQKNCESRQNLLTHRRRIHGVKREKKPEQLECEKCHKSFKTEHYLKEHIRKVHSHEKEFNCDTCHRGFNSEVKLKRHVFLRHSSDPKDLPLDCNECGRKFLDARRRDNHISLVHRKERNFVCEVCSKSFTDLCYMRYHQALSHGSSPEVSDKLQCGHCGKHLSAPNALRLHIKSVHEKVFKVKCPICNVGRQNESSLKRHIRSAHTNDRPEVCSVCQSRFSDKERLNTHMKLHTGERPFKCGICGKGFIRKKEWQRHEAIHSGKKNVQCDQCGKKFPSKDTLISHRWYAHNNRKSTLPPRTILSKEVADRYLKSGNIQEKLQN